MINLNHDFDIILFSEFDAGLKYFFGRDCYHELVFIAVIILCHY
jgi:hypothetical protein